MLIRNSTVIQGCSDGDVIKKFSEDDISDTIDFCFLALNTIGEEVPEETNGKTNGQTNRSMERLAPDDERVIRGLHVFAKTTPMANMDEFANSNIDGFAPRLEHGNLGLMAVS